MPDESSRPGASPKGTLLDAIRRLSPVLLAMLAGLVAGIAIVIARPPTPSTFLGRTSLATPQASLVEASVAPAVAPASAPAPRSPGLLEAEAVAAARSAAPQAADWPARVAKAGRIAEVFTAMNEFDWSRSLDPNRWVWQVSFGAGEALDSQGTHVFLDFETGQVLWVMNTRG